MGMRKRGVGIGWSVEECEMEETVAQNRVSVLKRCEMQPVKNIWKYSDACLERAIATLDLATDRYARRIQHARLNSADLEIAAGNNAKLIADNNVNLQ